MRSLSRRSRLPGIKTHGKNVRPACSQGHPGNRVVREQEGWVCLDCMNEFLTEHNPGGIHNRSAGGVFMPKGVKNPGGLKIDDLVPNRAARRRAKRLR